MFFDHVATLSGGEIALLNLIRHLDPEVVDSVVVLGEEGPLADRLRDYAEVHILPLQADVQKARKDGLGAGSFNVKSLRGAMAYVYQLARFIRFNHIDIVHTNSLKADVLGGFAAKLTRTPLIWHVRDRITADYLPSKVAMVFRQMSGWVPTAVIANSHSTASTLSKIPSRRVHVVHDGTIVSEFALQSASSTINRHRDSPVVGLVGRISPWKGQDVFLRAARLVLLTYPKARFHIIGAALFDELDYEKSLHRLANDLDLCEALTFTGFRHDIHEAIAGLDILVHASTKPEPFGQVIIEGMAAAKPVVATNAGGVPEIVEDGVTGLLVPMNDPERMAEAISTLLSSPEASHAMGVRAQDHIAQHFTIAKTAAGVQHVYQQLLQ